MERASKYVIIIYIQVGPNAADKRFAWTNTPMVHRISREEWKDTASYVIVNLKLPNAVLCRYAVERMTLNHVTQFWNTVRLPLSKL